MNFRPNFVSLALKLSALKGELIEQNNQTLRRKITDEAKRKEMHRRDGHIAALDDAIIFLEQLGEPAPRQP